LLAHGSKRWPVARLGPPASGMELERKIQQIEVDVARFFKKWLRCPLNSLM
jgi:hypothetical protein